MYYDFTWKQVAEKEIYCLKQSLAEEKARSDKLAKELSHLKSSFLCKNIVSKDKIVTKEAECKGNGVDVSAESDYLSMDLHEVRKKQYYWNLILLSYCVWY